MSSLPYTQVANDSRVHPRVSIHLPVAVRKDSASVILTTSINISEGGVLIKNPQQFRPAINSLVQVHIDGVIDPDSDEEVMLHPMRVVRVDDQAVALQFI